MSDTLLLIIVPVVALGGLAGVAYWLERRSKKKGPIANLELPNEPPMGPVGKTLLWASRILIVLMVISVIACFAFKMFWLIWISGGCIVLGLVAGRVGRVARLTGK